MFRVTLIVLLYPCWLAAQVKLEVASDGSAKYKSVQSAFDAVPINNKTPYLIYVKSGVYKEKLHLDSTKDKVTLIGEDKFNTIITWDDHTGTITASGDTIKTYTSETFAIRSNDFIARDITFDNSSGFTAGQAVAVQAAGDRLVFINCRFTGNQDVLFTVNSRSRQYYQRCYIEGTTDFIFGAATAWFEQCHIHSKKNSHVTAASTPQGNDFGYVFSDCILTGDSTLQNVSLGRPWRPFAAVVYLHCYLGQHIKSEGWSKWNNNDNHLTARYAEYKNYGPGAGQSGRLSWSRQLTDQESKKYNLKNVFSGWYPFQQ